MRLLFCLLLVIPFFGFSQITLTDTDFGNAGDTARMSSTTDLSVDFSSTGINFNWDFSMFVAESQTLLEFNDMSNASSFVQILFGSFAPADYQASYFAEFDDLPLDQIGQFLPVNITNLYQFSRITSDSISSVGLAIDVDGNEIPFRSDLIEKRYELPLNFGDSYDGEGYTEIDLNPFADIVWRQRRTRNSVVDGWGTVALPMGSFDVLRVKHTIEETDSLYSDFLGTGTPTWFGIDLPTSHIYEWIANGEKEVVLRIETSEIGGFETVTNIEYRDNYNPALATLVDINLESVTAYPNPASSTLHFDGVEFDGDYVIYNTQGEKVAHGLLETGSIDISNLASGSYILIGQSATGSFKAPFVKE